MTDVLTDAVLTNEEKLAHLDAEQLRQLVGLVEYDASGDPFPVTGWDAVVWVVGNATQTALHYRTAYGMRLVAYAGPETGQRDHKAYVLTSGGCRFVIMGGVAPDSPLLDHHRKHGDGVSDISLEVPDVDVCVAHAVKVGARVLVEPHDVADEHGTVRTGHPGRVRRHHPHPGRPVALHRPLPARLRGLRRHGGRATAPRSSGRWTTWSATSSSAGWTSGWTSTTG